MKCEFCSNEFSNKQNLNYHQKKAKYCLKLQKKDPEQIFICDGCNKQFTSNVTLVRHKKGCSSTELIEQLRKDNDNFKNKITSLTDMNMELRTFLKDLQDRYDNLSLTAVKRPTTSTKNVQINNYIKNMAPLLQSDITDNVHNLTLEHHSKGPEGYAEYALEFPFKDKIVCVDTARNKIKYKNEDGDVVDDVGFRKMMVKLCTELKDRSFSLSQEHYEKLSDTFTEKEVEEYNFMEAAIAISKYANGRESDFCNEIVKMISNKSSR
jgi:hypothetical protein